MTTCSRHGCLRRFKTRHTSKRCNGCEQQAITGLPHGSCRSSVKPPGTGRSVDNTTVVAKPAYRFRNPTRHARTMSVFRPTLCVASTGTNGAPCHKTCNESSRTSAVRTRSSLKITERYGASLPPTMWMRRRCHRQVNALLDGHSGNMAVIPNWASPRSQSLTHRCCHGLPLHQALHHGQPTQSRSSLRTRRPTIVLMAAASVGSPWTTLLLIRLPEPLPGRSSSTQPKARLKASNVALTLTVSIWR